PRYHLASWSPWNGRWRETAPTRGLKGKMIRASTERLRRETKLARAPTGGQNEKAPRHFGLAPLLPPPNAVHNFTAKPTVAPPAAWPSGDCRGVRPGVAKAPKSP